MPDPNWTLPKLLVDGKEIELPLRCVHQTATMEAYMPEHRRPGMYCIFICENCGQPIAMSKKRILSMLI